MEGEEYLCLPSLKMKTKEPDVLLRVQSSVTHPKVVTIDSEWLLTLLYKNWMKKPCR